MGTGIELLELLSAAWRRHRPLLAPAFYRIGDPTQARSYNMTVAADTNEAKTAIPQTAKAFLLRSRLRSFEEPPAFGYLNECVNDRTTLKEALEKR